MTVGEQPSPAGGVRDPTLAENIRREHGPDPIPANHCRSRATDRPESILFIVGSCCVVLGGLVAAVTGPLKLDHGSWLAAYLVLVCGAAQCAIGIAQPQLAALPVRARSYWIELICWNVGNAAVITGTLAGLPIVADLGGIPLFISLVGTIRAVRTSCPTAAELGLPRRHGDPHRQHPHRPHARASPPCLIHTHAKDRRHCLNSLSEIVPGRTFCTKFKTARQAGRTRRDQGADTGRSAGAPRPGPPYGARRWRESRFQSRTSSIKNDASGGISGPGPGRPIHRRPGKPSRPAGTAANVGRAAQPAAGICGDTGRPAPRRVVDGGRAFTERRCQVFVDRPRHARRRVRRADGQRHDR